MIPEDQMTGEEIEAAQAATQQPQPEDLVVMLERMKEETLQMTQQNKATEHQIRVAELTTNAELSTAKIQSDILKNARTLEQNQEKIDNDAKDKFMKNAIAVAELEFKAQQEMNSNIEGNLSIQQ
jgi:hypothetical protein